MARGLVVINKRLFNLDMDVFDVLLDEAFLNVINTFKHHGVYLRGNSSLVMVGIVHHQNYFKK